MGEGSIPRISDLIIVRRMEAGGCSVGEEISRGSLGVNWEMRVRIVWRGSSGSQDSIQWVVGSKAPVEE